MDNNWFDLIMMRRSVRTFDPSVFSEDKKELILDYVKSQKTLFGSSFDFRAVAGTTADGKVGTYGTMKNPAFYLAGIANGKDYHPADYGYVVEKAVLMALGHGVGSCWIGGVFSKGSLASAAALQEGETIPAIIAMGTPKERRHFADVTSRLIAGSNRRKHPDQMFRTTEGLPLDLNGKDHLSQLIEAVLVAPSASNKQPWRMVVEDGVFHFFLERNARYNRMIKLGGLADLQMMDIGIALAHIELASGSLGLEHEWLTQEPESGMESGWEYVISCRIPL